MTRPTDYTIADDTGANVLSDINNVLQGLLTTNKGTDTTNNRPTYAVAGTLFIEGNTLKVATSSSSSGDTTIGDITAANLGLLSASTASLSNLSSIIRPNNTSNLTISGGESTTDGASILLNGGQTSNTANVFDLRTGSTTKLRIPNSPNLILADDATAVGYYSNSIFRGHRNSNITVMSHFTNTVSGAFSTDGSLFGVNASGHTFIQNQDGAKHIRFMTATSGKFMFGSSSTAQNDSVMHITSGANTGQRPCITFNHDGTPSGSEILGGFRTVNGSTAELASVTARHDGTSATARLVMATKAASGSSTSRMIITKEGHIRINQDASNTPGISTSDTTTGFAFETANCLYISRGDQTAMLNLNTNGNGGEFIVFRKSGDERGSIEVTNQGQCLLLGFSDYRLKENIVDIDDGITRLKKLKPKRFNFIEARENDSSSYKTLDGFLAHEVSEVCPEAVVGEKDGAKMQKLDSTKLITVTVAALQELIARVETLESK
tara:strand:- start:31 stop:1512 length:1482 start_codon:yes stop_codon:yes gene_type:complete